MAKRGYKLQEFVAHSSNVNCLSIGKKACRMFITGGDDHKVNLWAIGKPTSLMSLCGHTSPVESVAFDTAEVLILAGASAGAIKLWDLEEAKMVRTLTGHRSNCTAVEFHPFGEFFASGSADTNLKIWDIRKKGCIHTYRGHTRGVSTIRFTPDGRWVVSGGNDNVVKVWDLTAGKLLHDFKFHEGHIRSLDFHPLEFLLATGSADRTVKLWDLETFELIGATRPEATGVCTITFHPDGRTLFCGLDDSLKVFSWEPVICHDTVDIGWSTLTDLCIHEEKLLGCSTYRNSVAVWVADVARIEPYGDGFVSEESECTEKNFNIPKSDSPKKIKSGARSTSDLRSTSPDYEMKEIKNIYIDSAGGNLVSSQKNMSLSSPKVVPASDVNEMSIPSSEKKSSIIGVTTKTGGEALNKSFVAPWDSPPEKSASNSGRETVSFSRTKPGMLLRPAHVRRPSNSKSDVEKLAVTIESETLGNMQSEKESAIDLKLQTLNVLEDGAEKSCEQEGSNIKTVAPKFEKKLSPETPSSQENCDEPVNGSRQIPSVKIVNGVAVVSGRTRSLVERFERREKLSNEDQSTNLASQTVQGMNNNPSESTAITPLVIPEAVRKPPVATSTMTPQVIPVTKSTLMIETPLTPSFAPEMDTSPPLATVPTPCIIPMMDRTPSVTVSTPHVKPETNRIPVAETNVNSLTRRQTDRTPVTPTIVTPRVVPRTDRSPPTTTKITPSVTVSTPRVKPETNRTPVAETNVNSLIRPQTDRTPVTATIVTPRVVPRTDRSPPTTTNITPSVTVSTPRVKPETHRTPVAETNVNSLVRPQTDRTTVTATIVSPRVIPQTDRSLPTTTNITPHIVYEMDRSPSLLEEPQVSGRDSISSNYRDISDDLMQSHEVFLNTLKSRLTKLQVVLHFWERSDIKGAINALRKLPDHSVQADVISILMDKLGMLTLDLFSCLLPVLVGLLDSKMERHISVSLEMLLKLVAVFGPVIRSTVSAPRVVGVDLHAEQRLECCKQCFVHLQNIQQILPALIRKGGLLAKSAMELNLVLQQS